MSRHTPGPWTIMRRPDADGPAAMAIIHGPSENNTEFFSNWVADVGMLTPDGGSGSIQNAKLIAAAPELLAALQALEAAVLKFTNATPADWPELAASSAAIAKAGGAA